jgi:hypothetical protein
MSKKSDSQVAERDVKQDVRKACTDNDKKNYKKQKKTKNQRTIIKNNKKSGRQAAFF